MYLTMNRQIVLDGTATRGISASQRAVRINKSPLRAAAIVKGRQRLVKVLENRNPGFRPLSVLRLAAGMSQIELAQSMGMKQPNIARLEKNPGDPSLSTLKRLAAALGVEIGHVIAAVDATNKAGA
jgi:DNA-binding XRE family transcriptional regulator